MTGALYNADNVVVGEAMLMLTPYVKGAVVACPADLTPLFTPADTHWASWVSAGATDEGFKVTIDTSITEINIEEQSIPVDEQIESKGVAIEASLAEDTMESARYAWGGSDITVVAASTGVTGTKKMTLTDNVIYVTGCLETRNFNGYARRLYVPKLSVSGSGEVSFRRASAKHMYPVRFGSLCPPTSIQVIDITAPALP